MREAVSRPNVQDPGHAGRSRIVLPEMKVSHALNEIGLRPHRSVVAGYCQRLSDVRCRALWTTEFHLDHTYAQPRAGQTRIQSQRGLKAQKRFQVPPLDQCHMGTRVAGSRACRIERQRFLGSLARQCDAPGRTARPAVEQLNDVRHRNPREGVGAQRRKVNFVLEGGTGLLDSRRIGGRRQYAPMIDQLATMRCEVSTAAACCTYPHVGVEPVAEAWHRAQQASIVIAESPPQFDNALDQRILADDDAWPECHPQLVVAAQPVSYTHLTLPTKRIV